MTTAGFHEAVAAFSAPVSARPDPRTPARVTVLGSGVEGRALAAWFLAEGADQVSLFSVYQDELTALARGSITLRGDGPVGTFRVGGEAPSIASTSVLDRSVEGADLVVISGPVLKQRTYGLVVAPYLHDGQTILVVPGRSLAALELLQSIRAGGSTADVRLVEVDDLPFDIGVDGSTLTLTRRRTVRAGVYPGSATSVLEGLRRFFPELVSATSVLDSTLGDGSGIVSIPALLVGGPGAPPIESAGPPGAVLLNPNTFRGLIGDAQIQLVAALADERREVASRFGLRALPSDEEWLDAVAGSTEGTGVRAVPDEATARSLLRDAVLGSLVPLTSMANAAGVAAPVTEAMIELSERVLGTALRASGRNLDLCGLGGLSAPEIRARLAVAS